MPPPSGDLGAVIADHLDLQADAGHSFRGKVCVQLGRERFSGENNPLRTLGWRIELHQDGQVSRRRASGQRARVKPLRQPVREEPLRPEPVPGIDGRQRSELPQCPDPQLDEQIG